MDYEKDLSPQLLKKLNDLRDYLKELGSLAIGYSAGVDSTFMLAVAQEVLGDKVIAVTNTDASVPEREIEEAKRFCEQ